MAVKKKSGLGRGLGSLLANSRPENTDQQPSDGELRTLPIEQLQSGKYQPRRTIDQDSLQELADSIKTQGIIQPIVVRKLLGEKQRYEIIAGERRWRAAQLSELQDVPVVVREVSDQAALAMALIENIQREDLNPLEEAISLKRLITEFELTHQQAAEAVGRSRAAVSNLLRLLDLEESVKRYLELGDLEMGHARAILTLSDSQQRVAAQKIVTASLSVRETEKLVRKLLAESGKKSNPAKPDIDPDIRNFQENLSAKLGAKVAIQHSPKGKGQLVIQYNSLDELEGILDHIQ
ncbi:Chromosome (plasmid) partitioning protein ParB [hydrothermal vent metagenome]|uniref:Chromosome (Plasmid) partitioning protein ParB n=1 Tax=hydrothermal vent metagenome TaxID=652676 RepID=A0A3B0Z4E7_9ZZZZ